MARYALVTIVSTLTTTQSYPIDPRAAGTARAQLWASTSGSGGSTSSAGSTGGGSGGGGYSEEPALAITPGGSLAVTIPPGGSGGSGSAGISGTNPGDSTIVGPSGTVTAHPGLPGTCSSTSGALGGGAPASGNTIAFGGGNGSSGVTSSHGGSGGGSAGSQGAGGAAAGTTGGTAGTPDGAAGRNGPSLNGAGVAGAQPGGGAAGAHGGATHLGGQGGTGQAVITYQILVQLGATPNVGQPSLRRGTSRGSPGAPYTVPPPPVISPFYQPQQAQKGARLLRPGGHRAGKGAPYTAPGPVHVTPYHQPAQAQRGARLLRAGRSRTARGAPVKPFPASVVNQWAGTVTQSPVWGTSLPGIASCVVALTPASSVGGGSGTPTAGNWLFVITGWNAGAGPATVSVGDDTAAWWRPHQPSPASGGSRTTVWYQPDITPPTAVYVAPSAYIDGLAVTVIEVAGLGPWDTVTAVDAETVHGVAMGMSLPLPSAPAFMIAAVTGDSLTAGTALAAAGFTALTTVTAANGTDTSSDTVLVPAVISTSAAQSVTATATTTENLSGMMIGVLTAAPSPVPPGGNTAWPYLIFEAAFGAGYLTPPDQMTWVNLQTFAAGMRLRGWEETTGPQFQLDALEAAELKLVLDNPDGALSPFSTASPYYPSVIPGTPVRMRFIPPGSSRWYVIQRNIEEWPDTTDELLRGVVNAAGTDIWSVVSKELPTPYRAEVLNDTPGWWWPCDDGAVSNPTSLVNAAAGSAVPLQIVTAPGGLASSVSIPVGGATAVFLFSAIQAFAADGGWMYGDSNSASWAQTGTGSTSTGRYLTCTDPTFPPLANGVSVEGWWNFTFANTVPPNPALTGNGPPGQPAGNIVLWELNTGTGAVASLFLDTSGHLKFTFGGATTTVWAGSDLRNTTWFGATAVMTTTGWTVWLNGGVVAKVSGTGSATSAWTVFTANAVNGGTAGIGNPEISHLAIYPVALPAARVIAHFTAAYTAFGQMPPPAGLSQQFIADNQFAPDGNRHTGSFFHPPGTGGGANNTLAAYATLTAGAATSGPVNPESWAYCLTTGGAIGDYAWLAGTGPAAPTWTWYTSAASGSEQAAATTVENYLYANSLGSGAAVPTAASPLGDTVANRIERLLQAGGVTSPARCIDPSPGLVVAALDTGGTAAGQAVQAQVTSDGGFAFTDTAGNIRYMNRAHLAAQPVTWQLGASVAAGQIPYDLPGFKPSADPQRILNDIQVAKADVTGTGGGAASGSAETHGGLVFGPDATRYPAILASQAQNGPVPLRETSYLQDTTVIQARANWLADNFAAVRRRVVGITVAAEALGVACPQAWLFVLTANPGDVAEVFFTAPGQAAWSSLFRITRIDTRVINFEDGKAALSCQMDYYPPTEY